MATYAADDLTTNIINQAAAQPGWKRLPFDWNYATDPNNWEYMVVNTINKWVHENIDFTFDYALGDAPKTPSGTPLHYSLVTNNKSSNPVSFTPDVNEEIDVEQSWEITAGAKVTIETSVEENLAVEKGTVKVGFEGSLSIGSSGSNLDSLKFGFGNGVEVSAHNTGTFDMLINKEQQQLPLTIKAAAIVKDGISSIAYQDQFQVGSAWNIFDFDYLTTDQRTYEYTGIVNAITGTANVTYTEVPITSSSTVDESADYPNYKLSNQ